MSTMDGCRTVSWTLWLVLAGGGAVVLAVPPDTAPRDRASTSGWDVPADSGATDSGATDPDLLRQRQFEAVARDASALERQGQLLKRVVTLVKPSVVHIDATKLNSPRTRSIDLAPVEETGSGIIVQLDPQDGRKYILTNLHVVRGAPPENIQVRLADGRQLHPTKVWSDADTDLAVLAVSDTSLMAARIGDSQRVEIGDFVLAFGSPFGLSHSVTFGIVSAKGRRDLALGSQQLRIQEFLQTDAAINPGNSGGPLVNMRGEVVGINTAIASSSGGNEGIGFSIPINMARVVGRQLIRHGNVVYAYLGVQLDAAFTPATAAEVGLPRPGGARVKQVTPGSPAADANLRSGDVIMRFDGVDVEDDTHLVNLVGLTPVGRQLPVVVYRGGHSMTIQATLTERRLFDSH